MPQDRNSGNLATLSERYTLLAAFNRDIVLFVRAEDGRIVEANAAAETAYGYTTAELLELTAGDLEAGAAHPDDGLINRPSGGAVPVSSHRRKDGRTFPVEVSSHEAVLGGVPMRLVVVRDITDLAAHLQGDEALRQSERLYRAIGESIDYGVWVCTPDGRNTYASESFLKMVGQTQEECSNFGWGEVLHPDDAQRTIGAWQECVRTGGTWDIEHRFRGVDGLWHDVLARGVPVRNDGGEIVCWAGINLDISGLKKAEKALRESDQRKGRFLATLSHELRNPLAPIRYAIDLLGHDDVQGAGARARRVIERQVAHLARLVDELLDLNRIATGKVKLRRRDINFTTLVEQVVEAASLEIEGLTHHLAVHVPAGEVRLVADPDRLEQVLSNLLNNAARYTPSGGHITVTVEESESDVTVSVRDTGVGLSPEDRERVFEMFAQVGEPGHGGLGIGLTLVKGMVELHGGDVSVQSDGPGCGSCFRVRLPKGGIPAEEPGPSRERERTPAGRRILVVEDNTDSADMLSALLEVQGHDVRVAHDGASALAVLSGFPADVGLLDIGLPDMSGYDLARQLREREPSSRMYLVAVTGWGQEEDRQRARAAGFDAHITKPADPDEIRALLDRG